MNLTQMIARVREDLQDTDSDNYRWTDSEIESAIQRCVHDYSMHAPIEQQTDVATTDGQSQIDISSLTGLLQIASVEFPIGKSPRYYQTFEMYAGTLYMQDEGDGTNARIRWLKKHTLTAQQSTIPEEHEEIIVLGATASLAMSASISTVDRAFIAGRYGTIGYRTWARQRRFEYLDKLARIGRQARLRRAQLYTEND